MADIDTSSDDYRRGYSAGLDGETFTSSNEEEFAGYLAGRKDSKISDVTPRIDGVGFTVLACAFVVFLIYPIAGGAAVGALLLTWGYAEWSGMLGTSPWVLPLMLVAALVAFFPGFAVERRLSYRKSYRTLRNLYRIAIAAVIPISMVMTTGQNVPDGGLILFAFLLIPIAYWLLKRIDRAVGAAGAG